MLKQLSAYTNEICDNKKIINEKIKYIIEHGYFARGGGMVIAHKKQSVEDDNNSTNASHITETDKDTDYYYILKSNGQVEKLVKVNTLRFTHGNSSMYSNRTYDFCKCGIEEIMMETDFDISYRLSFKTRSGFDYLFVSDCVADWKSMDARNIRRMKRIGNNKGDGLIHILNDIISNSDKRSKALSYYDKMIKEIADYKKAEKDKVDFESKKKEDAKRKLQFQRRVSILNAIASLFTVWLPILFMVKVVQSGSFGTGALFITILFEACYLVTLCINCIKASGLDGIWMLLVSLESMSYLLFTIYAALCSESMFFLGLNVILYIVMVSVSYKLDRIFYP